jgi:hypothetical protein
MAFRFTHEHAISLVTPHLLPGEQIVSRSRGVEKPWYSLIFYRMGSIFWRYWLVVATNQRVLFIRHKGLFGGYGMKSMDAVPWQHVEQVKLGWGIFNKNLRVRAPAARIDRTVALNRFWLPNNFGDGEQLVFQWQRSRAGLGPGQMARALAA